MKIYQKLKEMRIQKGWTQEQLANYLHVANSTISQWESGKRTLHADVIEKMADLFQMEVLVPKEMDELEKEKVTLEEELSLMLSSIRDTIFNPKNEFLIMIRPLLHEEKKKKKRYPNEWSSSQKVAILLMALGIETSSFVMKQLKQEEVEMILLEVSYIESVDFQEKVGIVHEFHQMLMAQEYILKGGIYYAQEMIEKTFDTEKAKEMVERLTTHVSIRPFDMIRNVDTEILLPILEEEGSLSLAVILTFLEPEQAAKILDACPPEMQMDIVTHMTEIKRMPVSKIYEMEKRINEKLMPEVLDVVEWDGVHLLAQILQQTNRTTEHHILKTMDNQSPDLSQQVKDALFPFESVSLLDSASIQRVLGEIEKGDLLYALKGADVKIREFLYDYMSEKMSKTIRDEVDYLGPVRLSDAEDAQKRIIDLILHLENKGEIFISRQEDMIY